MAVAKAQIEGVVSLKVGLPVVDDGLDEAVIDVLVDNVDGTVDNDGGIKATEVLYNNHNKTAF